MDISGLEKISEVAWRVPPTGRMRVPGILYADEALLRAMDDKVLGQVRNVAALPGIVGASYAMPDAHWGYGFPIGGVAAFDAQEGIISPGGVGYDINCGVRLVASHLRIEDVKARAGDIVRSLFHDIPSGPSPHDTGFGELSARELRRVLERGEAHCAAGEMIDDHAEPPREGPALRQCERQLADANISVLLDVLLNLLQGPAKHPFSAYFLAQEMRGMLANSKFSPTPEASAISMACPRKPKPVMSVPARKPNSVAS